jgi:hypothetical protein
MAKRRELFGGHGKSVTHPKYYETDLFIYGFIAVLLFATFKETRPIFTPFFGTPELGLHWSLLEMVFFRLFLMIGIIFSVLHAFLIRKKTTLERYAMLLFASVLSTLLALYGIVGNRGTTSIEFILWLVVFFTCFGIIARGMVTIMFLVNPTVVLYRLWKDKAVLPVYLKKAVPDRNASFKQILVAAAVVGLVFTAARLYYGANWSIVASATLGFSTLIYGWVDRDTQRDSEEDKQV